MSKFLMAIIVTLSLTRGASAQTASDLANKYAHHEVYEVQAGILVTARLASNGLVCEMQIEQEHFGKNGVDMTYGISKYRIDGLIDQLVPSPERGKKDTKSPSGMATATGQVMESFERYANVDVRLLWTISDDASVAIITWRYRKCEP